MNLPLTLTLKREDLITKDVIKLRDNLALRGKKIETVTTGASNDMAGEVVRDIRKYVKSVADARKSLTKPLDDATTLLISIEREHCEPLVAEQKRLERLGTNFLEAEQRRVADEERKRQEAFAEAQRKQFELDDAARKAAESGSSVQQMIANRKLAQAQSEVQTIIATPEPEAERAHGQTMKQILCYEVLDIKKVYAARPELCKLEISPAAVKATCHPNLPIPGLRLWFENKSTYSTR